jgi:hypothetical protein
MDKKRRVMARGNPNPVQTPEFKQYRLQPIGTNEKMGTKVYGTRVPMEIQQKLEDMPQKERVILIREAIIKAVKEHE